MKLTLEDIEFLIEKEEYQKMGQKTTVCLLTLKSGFEIVTSSSCVDPNNYNHDLGQIYSRQRAIDKLWELAGYNQQCKHDKIMH